MLSPRKTPAQESKRIHVVLTLCSVSVRDFLVQPTDSYKRHTPSMCIPNKEELTLLTMYDNHLVYSATNIMIITLSQKLHLRKVHIHG
jgi:hypothetical protein